MDRKTKQTSIRLEPARFERWRRLAADIGVSPNEAVGLMIDAAELQSPVLPVKVDVKANGAEPVKVNSATL